MYLKMGNFNDRVFVLFTISVITKTLSLQNFSFPNTISSGEIKDHSDHHEGPDYEDNRSNYGQLLSCQLYSKQYVSSIG